jgi:hypothetical protein
MSAKARFDLADQTPKALLQALEERPACARVQGRPPSSRASPVRVPERQQHQGRDDGCRAIHPAIVLTCDGYQCKQRHTLISPNAVSYHGAHGPREVVRVGLLNRRHRLVPQLQGSPSSTRLLNRHRDQRCRRSSCTSPVSASVRSRAASDSQKSAAERATSGVRPRGTPD